MSCLALALQPANGPDILLQTREWFPPSRALMALSSFRETRLSFAKNLQQLGNFASDPYSDLLGDDPLAASSGQVIVGIESRYRVVYRLVNSIYVLAVTTVDDSNINVFECINVVNQAVSVVVAACRGVDVTPEKLAKKYAEIYMALDIVLKGVSSIRLAAMLATMHGESIAKMVHSSAQTESKIRGAESWSSIESQAIDHEAGIESFSKVSFELPVETLEAGDEVAAAALGILQQTDEKEAPKTQEIEPERDPFAASERINKPQELLLVEDFKKDRDSGVSDVSKALAGLEITALPPAAATDSTHIGVEGFEGDYGGIEFSTEGSSTLPDDFEGINDAWGGGLDASEYVGSKKPVTDKGLGGLELLATSEPPPKAGVERRDGRDASVAKAETMKDPEMYLVEEINAEFRESLLARVGMIGVLYLKTIPPPKAETEAKEVEFSFRVEGTDGVKRFAVQSSKLSSLGGGLFHVRAAPSEEPIPLAKYALQPRKTPVPLRVRLVKRLSGTLLSMMIQYAPDPDMAAPLSDVTVVLKLPADPTLLQVSPRAVLSRAERELRWRIDEIAPGSGPARLRARMPLEIDGDDNDDGLELEIYGYVKFSCRTKLAFSGISISPASSQAGKIDFYETDHRFVTGDYICN